MLLQNPVTKHIPSDAMNKVRKGFDYNKRKISLVICFSRICYYILDHYLQVKQILNSLLSAKENKCDSATCDVVWVATDTCDFMKKELPTIPEHPDIWWSCTFSVYCFVYHGLSFGHCIIYSSSIYDRLLITPLISSNCMNNLW